MPPRLCDPYAGPAGAPGYIDWWGDVLYRDWCRETGAMPLSYKAFRDVTLQFGKDWWADGVDSVIDRPGKRARSTAE